MSPRSWRRTHLGTDADRATFHTLHTAGLAAPALREGLTTASAERAVPHLRALLDTPALALTDTAGLLAWDGVGSHHEAQVPDLVASALDQDTARVADLGCDLPGVPGAARRGEPAHRRGPGGRHPHRAGAVPHGQPGARHPRGGGVGVAGSSSSPSSTRPAPG